MKGRPARKLWINDLRRDEVECGVRGTRVRPFQHRGMTISTRLSVYIWPPAAPRIFNPPPSPAHASQYRPGCQATTPAPPPVSTLPTQSPLSTCATSKALPSSLPPTTKLPSKLKLTLLTVPTSEVKVRLHTQSVVSYSEIRASVPPMAR